MGSGRAAETGVPARRSRRARITGILLLAVALACIAVITLTPAEVSETLAFWCLRCGAHPAVDVLLNVLMFAPLGVALSLLRVRTRWVILFILCITLSVEAMQYAVVAGRFASARDIAANTVGGMIAWRIALTWRSLLSPSPTKAFVLGLCAAALWITTQLFTAWAMNRSVPSPPWWAQIRRRDLGFPAFFRGEVVRSSVGTVTIRYSDQLEEAETVRRQLIDGAPLKTVVTGGEPTKGAAPILVLATDDGLSEIDALVQTGTGAFFRARTRAAVVGFHNPALRLDGVFPLGSAADTIAVSGRFADGRYWISTDHRGQHRERTLAASASWIWALLMPIPHYAFGREVRYLTAVWILAALGLAGLWAGQGALSFAGRRRAEARALAAAPVIAAIGLGLGVIPVAFGLPVSHWSEWLAAIAGVVCGWMAGQRLQRGRAANGVVAAGPG